MLTSPRCGFTSGEESIIFIGDKFPVCRFDPSAGVFQHSYVDLGLRLEILTYLQRGDNHKIQIRLKLNVMNPVELANRCAPIVATDTGQIELLVDSEEEIVISGFGFNDVTDSIPLLRDLPVLGPLYQSPEASERLVLIIKPYAMH